MLDERFADGSSFIHRLDPRVKVFFAFIFSAFTAVAGRFAALILAVLLAVLLVAMARLSVRAVIQRITIVNGFVLLLWLMLPFTFPGETLFHVGPLPVSRGGIVYALLITLKSNAIILACIALLSTTHLIELGRALGWLRVPDKIVHVLLFMLRYLGVVWREYYRLNISMKVRSFKPRTNLHTYRSYASMVGMLLVNSYEKSEAVYAAMLCRGFRGRFYTLNDFAASGMEIFFGVGMMAALLLMGLVQWTRLIF